MLRCISDAVAESVENSPETEVLCLALFWVLFVCFLGGGCVCFQGFCCFRDMFSWDVWGGFFFILFWGSSPPLSATVLGSF